MKTRRTDHSGLPRDKLPKIPQPDLVLFHWSPSFNRSRINHSGLVPGSISERNGLRWRPPYVCLSEDPVLAWILSGKLHPEIKSWDLWGFNTKFQTSIKGWEIITDTYIHNGVEYGKPYIKEYRIYTRIYKRDLDYIATRTQ